MEIAVVTGAAKGIGATIARRAAQAGYQVALWDVSEEGLHTLAAEIGTAAIPQVVDVTSEASVLAALDALPSSPRLLVNNAGIVRFGPLATLSVEDWKAALEVNLTGTFIAARAAAARMGTAGGGVIINIASVNGVAAAPNAGAYTASKAAVIRLTEQMAIEWADEGVRVNVVAPGLILAGMSDEIYADEEARLQRQSHVPLGRIGTADQVADSVLFLASDQADYITGQMLAVDGGLTKSALRGLSRPKSVDMVGL